MSKREEQTETSNSQEKSNEYIEGSKVEYMVDGQQLKEVVKAKAGYNELYDRKVRNLQIIALVMVLMITFIAPLRLLDSRTYVDFTAIGFIIAGLVPSIIAIFDIIGGRKFALYLSVVIYGAWIMVLSTQFWEIILLITALIIYYEITRILLIIHPLLKNIESIAKGGAYYHANVFLGRYFRYFLKFSGLLIGSSFVLGVLGWYVFEPLQSDIIFSVFMIICLITLIIVSRKTLTPDIEKIILEEERERLEDNLARSHSKYS